MKPHICSNCGHSDVPPMYDLRKPKRKRYELKDELYCHVCKNHTDISDSMKPYFTQEEMDARQVGKPCSHNDGGVYKPAIGYFEIYVCKKCGHDYNG